MIINSENTQSKRYIPAADWVKFHPWPTISGLRWLIFNRKTNGFDMVIKKVGKRILLDESAFFQWIADQNEGEQK